MRNFLVNLFAFAAITVASFFALSPAHAGDVCFTPSQFKANIETMEKNGNFDATIFEYTGDQAQAVRAFAAEEADVDLSKVVDFDTIILAVHPQDPNVFSVMFKNGCKIAAGMINKPALDKMQQFLKGI